MSLFQVIADHYGPRTAASYDELARSYFWGYEESLRAAAAELVYGRRKHPDQPRKLDRILDLGIGTGNLSAAVLGAAEASRVYATGRGSGSTSSPAPPEDAEPFGTQNCLIRGLDASCAMMDFAREKLRAITRDGIETEIELREEKLEALETAGHEPGSWDAVVSSYAIHHLDDSKKAALFGKIRELLAPGGVFLLVDKVFHEAPGSKLDRSMHAVMGSRFAPLFRDKDKKTHYSSVLDEIQRQFDDDGDQPATIETLRATLLAAGLEDARMPFLSFGCAVFSAIRPTHRAPAIAPGLSTPVSHHEH